MNTERCEHIQIPYHFPFFQHKLYRKARTSTDPVQSAQAPASGPAPVTSSAPVTSPGSGPAPAPVTSSGPAPTSGPTLAQAGIVSASLAEPTLPPAVAEGDPDQVAAAVSMGPGPSGSDGRPFSFTPFKSAYADFSTRRVIMEERNVYCGSFNTFVLTDQYA